MWYWSAQVARAPCLCRAFKMWQTSFSCISKPASPASFFSGFLHDLVVSCLLLRIAPVRSVQVNRSQPCAKTCQYTTWQKQTCQNMPQQTCQIMSGYHLPKINKDTGIKHGSIPPEAKSKATDSNSTCSNHKCIAVRR